MNGSSIRWLIHSINAYWTHVIYQALVCSLGEGTQWWRQSPCSPWHLSSTAISFQNPSLTTQSSHTSSSNTLSPLEVTMLYLVQKCLSVTQKSLVYLCSAHHLFTPSQPHRTDLPQRHEHVFSSTTGLPVQGWLILSAHWFNPTWEAKFQRRTIHLHFFVGYVEVYNSWRKAKTVEIIEFPGET